MDKYSFFASLYESVSDNEAPDHELPPTPRLVRDVRELKQPRAAVTQKPSKQGADDPDLSQKPQIASVKLPRARTKSVRTSPKAPFYCMDDSTAKRPRQRDPASLSEQPAPTHTPSDSKPHVKPRPIAKSTMASSNSPRGGKKRLPWNDAETKSKHSGARKRSKGSTELPDHKKIFRGLFFYYFPNSDVSPARKFRIKKATERGATRLERFETDVTHIIVDSDRTYGQLLEHLKVPNVPIGIHVVNDYYSAECIEFGFLIDPLQRRFRIEGYVPLPDPSLETKNTTEVPADAAEESLLEPLQVNNEGKGIPDELAKRPPQDECQGGDQQVSKAKKSPAGSSRDGPMTLEEAIEDAHRVSQLPIDEFSDSSDQDELKATDNGSDPLDVDTVPVPKTPAWQETFQCMRAHDCHRNADNPNAQTIEILQQMTEYYERTEDQWRCMSYRKAIGALRQASKKIETKEEALAIRGIGERLAAKIEEIVQTSRLRRLEHAQAEPTDETLKLFKGIYGAGTKQARTWIGQGHRTLEDLLANATLTPTQRIGIAHHADFAARIPRAEVTQHGMIVKTALAALDPRVQAIVGGSYRRGAASSGDVDFLIIGPDEMSRSELHTLMFDRLVPALFAADYLQCALASPSSSTGTAVSLSTSPSSEHPEPPTGTGSKWHGAARLPHTAEQEAPWRRVDLLLVPAEEQGAAMLYFTGNDIFNRSMRLLARKRGMRLNQRGLWQRADGVVGPNGGHQAGTLLEGRSEKKVFEILGVPWREVWERDC